MKTSPLKLNGQVILPECGMATGFFARFKGLMGRRRLREDEAIFFPNCNSIHTFFMLIPIDVIFVSQDGIVMEILEGLKAWRMLLPRPAVKHTLEMRQGRSRELGIKVGHQLSWKL